MPCPRHTHMEHKEPIIPAAFLILVVTIAAALLAMPN